jgi:hypothetical protein
LLRDEKAIDQINKGEFKYNHSLLYYAISTQFGHPGFLKRTDKMDTQTGSPFPRVFDEEETSSFSKESKLEAI